MEIPRRFVLPAPNQIGIAVENLTSSIARYEERYGLKPNLIETIELDERWGYRYRGDASACRLKVALFEQGTIQLELIELLEGQHPVGDFLRERGEGINHLGFFVEDLPATLKQFGESAAQPVIEGRFALTDGRAGAFVWLKDDDDGGVMFEISAFK